MTKKLGATGEYPEGRLHDDDQGELVFALGVRDGNVVINFGKEVSWLAMKPQVAADLAAAIIKHARKAARQSGTTLMVTIA